MIGIDVVVLNIQTKYQTATVAVNFQSSVVADVDVSLLRLDEKIGSDQCGKVRETRLDVSSDYAGWLAGLPHCTTLQSRIPGKTGRCESWQN